ncbi:hypothetical protein V8B97DRAFT_2104761 [Scleroderma yunnanense]
MSNLVPNISNLGVWIPPQLLPEPCYNFAPLLPPASLLGRLNVYIPSAWQKVQQLAPPVAHPAVSSHLMALPSGSLGYKTISLEISAVFKARGKKKNVHSNNISSICEGLKDIDTQSTAHELASIALGTRFVVHDSKWVNITRHTSIQPYFYNKCLHPSNQKGSKAVAFKTKQFRLFVIIPETQWEEFETFFKKLEPPPPTHPQRMPQWHSEPPTPLFISKGLTASTASSSMFNRLISQDILQVGNNDTNTMSVKCHHHHSSSTSSGSGITLLPQKKHIVFSSPNCDQLREGLQSEGACEFDVKRVFQQKIMQVDLYPIPTCNLNELIHMKMGFNIKAADLLSGNIRLDLSANSITGVGAFKTAQSVQLTLFPLTHSDIGSEPNCEIVLKRHYTSQTCSTMKPMFLPRNCHPLEFLTYVCGCRAIIGILICANSNCGGTVQSVKSSSMISTMYLAEELITISLDGDFVKYIHNSDAVPCNLLGPEVNSIEQFLAFMQHVQYVKTSGQVYISDYQVSQGQKLFGDGNVQKGVELFEKEHICNMFCKWAGFGLSAFSSLD